MTRFLLILAVFFLVGSAALRFWPLGAPHSPAVPVEQPLSAMSEANQNALVEAVAWPDRNFFVRLNSPERAETPVQRPAFTSRRAPELLGIVVRDEVRLVWLRDQSGRAQAYRLGEDASGWRVEEIERTRVRLSIGEREEWIGLFGAGAEPD